MNNHRTEVDQHPFPGLRAFDAEHPATAFFHFFADVIGQRTHLPVGVTAGDNDLVEQRSSFGNVKHDDIATLDVFQCSDGGFCEFVR